MTQTNHPPRQRRAVRLAAALASATLLLSGCAGAGASDVVGGAGAATGAKTTLSLYAFSVAKPAFDSLGTAYAATPEGAGTVIQTSYGPSGDQSRKVAAGAPADLVALSLSPDVTRLVQPGLVAKTWDDGNKGTPFGSVVVIVVRKGNPKQIRDWNDLLKPGVSVVTPNPLSSGSAQWNLLAPYSAASNGGQNPAAGLDYIKKLVGEHIHTQPSSGAEATESFRQGTGDVLLSYENEAISAIKAGDAFDYFVPPQTFKIENAVAPIATSQHADAVAKFLTFVASAPGQEAIAKAGFRPADATVLAQHPEFVTPQKLWTIADLGGWPKVTSSLFDKSTGAITQIYTKATR